MGSRKWGRGTGNRERRLGVILRLDEVDTPADDDSVP
jgi:hypothetical protein